MPLAILRSSSVAVSNSTAVGAGSIWMGSESGVPILEPSYTKEQISQRFQDFIGGLEQFGSTDGRHISLEPLAQLLYLTTQEANETIRQAMKKKDGYWKRLFSGESWSEWSEDKTPLGKVITVFADYMDSSFILEAFMRRLDIDVIHKANEEAAQLLQVIKNDTEEKSTYDIMASITNFVSSTDKIISSLLPLPLMAAAKDEAESTASKLIAILDKTPMTAKEFVDAANGIRRVVREVNESSLQAAQHEEAKKIYEEYKKMYNSELAKYKADKEKFFGKSWPDHAYYYYEDYVTQPTFFSAQVKSDVEENGEIRCIERWFSTPGYIRWSIYDKEWGRDPLVAEGGYNYNKDKGKPTVPEQSSAVPNFCQ